MRGETWTWYLKITHLTAVFTALTCLHRIPQCHPSTGLCSFSNYPGGQQNGTYWDAYQGRSTEAYSSSTVKSCSFNWLKSTYVSLNHLRTLITDSWNKFKNINFLFRMHHVYYGIYNNKCPCATHASAWKGNKNKQTKKISWITGIATAAMTWVELMPFILNWNIKFHFLF